MVIPYFYQISGIPSFVWALDIGVWPPEPGPDTRYSVAAALWDLVLGEEDWKIIILTTLSSIIDNIFLIFTIYSKNPIF